MKGFENSEVTYTVYWFLLLLARLTLTGNNLREEGLAWAHSFREYKSLRGKSNVK